MHVESIEVWTIDLSAAGASSIAGCQELLCEEEKARAGRMGSRELRDRFVLRRAVLRQFLGTYLAEAASAVRFFYGPQDKPYLAGSEIEFSVSESGGVALFAFARGCEVGVDIEREREIPEMRALVEEFFHRGEAEDFYALPKGERQRAFFACWTRKEAFIKAQGRGLLEDLDGFRVTLRNNETARVLEPEGDWRLESLEHVPGYAAALAYRGMARKVLLRETTSAESLVKSLA